MPDAYLVDSGVFLRWFVPQIGFKHARAVRTDFLAGSLTLETVDNVRVEVAQALRVKGLLGRQLDTEQYLVAVRSIDDLGVVVHATGVGDLERTAELSAGWNISFFDALVVDRALQRELTLLTTDVRLANAVGDRLSTELLRGLG